MGTAPSSRKHHRILGTNADLSEFYRFVEHQPKPDALVRQFRGVKPPRFPTLFEALVNAIACQQLGLNVGILLLNRLSAAFGQSGPGQGALAHAFPAPENLARLDAEALRHFIAPWRTYGGFIYFHLLLKGLAGAGFLNVKVKVHGGFFNCFAWTTNRS